MITVTIVVSCLVNTSSIGSTRVVHALVPVVSLTVETRGAESTFTSVSTGVCDTTASVLTVVHQTSVVFSELAALSRESIPAGAEESIISLLTLSTIAARVVRAELFPLLAVSAAPAWLAVALVVVEQLDAV